MDVLGGTETYTYTYVGPCRYCNVPHSGLCPKIRAIEYYPDGVTVKRIEFHGEAPLVQWLIPEIS